MLRNSHSTLSLACFCIHSLFFCITFFLLSPLTIMLSRCHCCLYHCIFSFIFGVSFIFLLSSQQSCISRYLRKVIDATTLHWYFHSIFLVLKSICVNSANRNSIESMSIRLEKCKVFIFGEFAKCIWMSLFRCVLVKAGKSYCKINTVKYISMWIGLTMGAPFLIVAHMVTYSCDFFIPIASAVT